jgi:geranyl-CoA carboxylase beta subunit
MGATCTSARLLDDGVIDPRDTRELLIELMAITRDEAARQPNAIQFAVARP